MNQDADEFTLWSAKPTANKDLVAVDTQNQDVEEFCSSTTGGLITSTSTTVPNNPRNTAPAPRSGDPSSGKLSAGGIAGTAVGSAAVVAVVLGAVFWFVSDHSLLDSYFFVGAAVKQSTLFQTSVE